MKKNSMCSSKKQFKATNHCRPSKMNRRKDVYKRQGHLAANFSQINRGETSDDANPTTCTLQETKCLCLVIMAWTSSVTRQRSLFQNHSPPVQRPLPAVNTEPTAQAGFASLQLHHNIYPCNFRMPVNESEDNGNIVARQKLWAAGWSFFQIGAWENKLGVSLKIHWHNAGTVPTSLLSHQHPSFMPVVSFQLLTHELRKQQGWMRHTRKAGNAKKACLEKQHCKNKTKILCSWKPPLLKEKLKIYSTQHFKPPYYKCLKNTRILMSGLF